MSKLEVTVRVEESRRSDLHRVVEDLRHAGLSNVSLAARFGIVHGEVDAADKDGLKGVDGVASVRASQTFRAT